MKKILFLPLLLLAGLFSQLLHAASIDRVHFSGFASFIAAKSLEKKEPYGDATYTIPDKLELRDYTKLGLRVGVDLRDNLSFTTQMLADGRDDFKPEFDWIFLSYSITPDLILHLGKYVTSYYMYSDHSDISYAYQWVEAPNAVYGTNINKTLEGAKLVWTSSLSDDWSSELSLMTGKDKTDLSKVNVEGATLNMRSAFGFSWQVEHDWLTLRTSYIATRTSANLGTSQLNAQSNAERYLPGTPLDGAQNSAVFEHKALNKILNWKDSKGNFAGIGASTHFQKFFSVAEIAYSNLEDTIANGKQISGYLTVGTYLPRQVTLALTLYQKRNKYNQDTLKAINHATEDIVAQAMSSGDTLAVTNAYKANAFLIRTLNNIQNRNRQGFTLSSRWDFHNKAALKAEYMYEWQTDYPMDSAKKRNSTPQAFRVGVDLAF